MNYPFAHATKAETLAALRGKLTKACVPGLVYFPVAAWKNDPESLLMHLLLRFPRGSSLAVRSSAWREDDGLAHAGRYRTCINIPSEKPQLSRAIEAVVRSYKGDPRDQVLVQEMVQCVAMNGVVFTRDLETGAPYYRIEYDDELLRTDAVTAGLVRAKTFQIYRQAVEDVPVSDPILPILEMTKELESQWGGVPLDIEFARSNQGRNYVLQVRPIPMRRHWNPGIDDHFYLAFRQLKSFLEEKLRRKPGLAGETTIMTQMSDWNPAELIGPEPMPLAFSLFHDLISSSVWQQARSEMGYRPTPDEPLVCLLAGKVFVDVRLSLNSFLPADLGPSMQERLVNAWLDRLGTHPELHDRVEFEVAQTTIDFTFENDFQERYDGALTRREFDRYSEALLRLTSSALSLSPGVSFQRTLAEIDQLHNLQKVSGRLAGLTVLQRIFSLVRECIRSGSHPFVVIARHAFIAEAILRSAVRRGAWSPERLASFRSSIETVTGRMRREFAMVLKGRQEPHDFLLKYGHLRPGSFDIESLRYDQRLDLFVTAQQPFAAEQEIKPFQLTAKEITAFSTLIKESRLNLSVEELLIYARRAIWGREYAKFVFSRHLSDILEGIASWAAQIGLTRGEAAFLTLDDLKSSGITVAAVKPQTEFLDKIERRKNRREANRGLRLGYIIRGAADLYRIPVQTACAHFVTGQRVEAPVFLLTKETPCSLDLYGRIVCIESADPGFDWIFTRDIAGLVTKFGGANSHMAIRCAEMQIAAAIGVGEEEFDRVLQSHAVELNCRDRRVCCLYA